jgi:hypothetical protein
MSDTALCGPFIPRARQLHNLAALVMQSEAELCRCLRLNLIDVTS